MPGETGRDAGCSNETLASIDLTGWHAFGFVIHA